MAQVDRFDPQSMKEALALLAEHGENAKVIAGGTDLLIQFKKERVAPKYYISIQALPSLDFIRKDEDGLHIGALTRIHDLEISEVVKTHCPILHQAACALGTPLIRRQATIGGNLCNASPSADTAPPLLALGAHLKARRLNTERSVAIADFFRGPGETVLEPDEILTEIHIPAIEAGYTGFYYRMTRTRAADCAAVGVATLLQKEGDRIKDIRIALGAIAPTPIRATAAEAELAGKKFDSTLLEKCVQAAVDASSPINDIRCSADYRKSLTAVLVKRTIQQAMQ